MEKSSNPEQLNSNKIFKLLLDLNIPISEYVVFGSGPMFACGIRPLADLNDVDVLISEEQLRRLANELDIKIDFDSNWGAYCFDLYGDKLEFYTKWGTEQLSLEDIKASEFIVDGIPFASLENVKRWKMSMGREKDRIHIDMINNYLES